jgi:hypothetical protein
MEKIKRLHPSIETQTDPDAILVETQEQLSALAEANDSLHDDVDGLNYKVGYGSDAHPLPVKYCTDSGDTNV